MVPLRADIASHAVQLVDEHEAALEDVLRHDAGAPRQRQQHHQLRLQVCGESREREGLDVGASQLRPAHGDAVGGDLEFDARLRQLIEYQPQMRRLYAFHLQPPAGHCARDQVGAGLDPVADDAVGGAVQVVAPLHLYGGGPLAAYPRAHAPQEPYQVLYLGLARRVLDAGRPGSGDGRHEDVLGRSHAREGEVYPRSP